jgi:hypothetical protein
VTLFLRARILTADRTHHVPPKPHYGLIDMESFGETPKGYMLQHTCIDTSPARS